MEIYLDNAATTRVCPEAAAAALDAMTAHYGNPSSTHRMGREAKKLLDRARGQVSAALGCAPEEFYFTSGGTEGDNWAILQGALGNRRHGRHILSSAVEHSAVLRCLEKLEGFSVTYLKPEPDGSISPATVLDALREDTCLVTLMLVNNETGAVTDIGAIASAVRQRNPHTLIHTDAVQAFLKIPFQAKTLGADLVTVSGHKIHAPKGIGGLYIQKSVHLRPLLQGGGQERGLRSGTEALPLAAAFGAAVAAAWENRTADQAHMAALRERCVQGLSADHPGLVRFVGGGAPQILSLSLPGWRSEVLMNFLEAREIYVSKSSACKRGGRSYVLEALGLDAPVIDGAIRVSFSRFSTEAEVDAFRAALKEARETLRPAVSR